MPPSSAHRRGLDPCASSGYSVRVAADAGLRTDDAIIAIDAKPASQVSGWDLRRSMRASSGTKVTLSLIRNGQPLSVVVTLRELLPAAP